MSTSQPKPWVYLDRKPGSFYRQLVVKGRNIFARTLYSASFGSDEEPGLTPEEIADDYDLPLEAVLEAIAYCQSDPPEIRADWEDEEALAEASGMNDPDYKYHPSPKPLTAEEIGRFFHNR